MTQPARRLWQRLLGPLRARTTAVAVVVVAAALGVGGLTLVVVLRRSLESAIIENVSSRADDVATLVREDRLPDQLTFVAADAALVQVVDANGKVVASTPNVRGKPAITRFTPPGNAPKHFALRTLPVEKGERFVVVAQRAAGPGGGVIVYTAASLDPADRGVRTLILALTAGYPVLLLLVGATTWLLTGRVVRPVDDIRSEVDEITARDLHRRVPVPETDDEISRLAHTMNDMLDRLDTSAQQQKRFVADASHELRSPLAVMRTVIEVNLAHPNTADWIGSSEELLVDHSRIERIVKDLLLLARLDAVAVDHPHENLDLATAIAHELARRTTGAVPISWTLQHVNVLGDREHLLQVLRNLLNNAQRYARTSIEVTLTSDDTLACLRVFDNGPGIATDQRERVFERFARLDDARTREGGGSGLGLAIVREIARTHHGSVRIVDVGHGTCFEVQLPAVRNAPVLNQRPITGRSHIDSARATATAAGTAFSDPSSTA